MTMKLRQLNLQELGKILERDHEVYPTARPVSLQTVAKWFEKYPQFAFGYEVNGQLVATCLNIPMSPQSWEKLLRNEIEEADIDHEHLFDPEPHSQIAIHIYHIEAINKSLVTGPLYERVFSDLGMICRNFNSTSDFRLLIAGISALATSLEGIGLFFNKLNFRPSETFKTNEFVVKTQQDGKVKVVEASNLPELIELCQREGLNFRNQPKMLICTPADVSLIWHFMNY